MRSWAILLMLGIAAIFIFNTCGSDNGNDPDKNPSGEVVNYSDCKGSSESIKTYSESSEVPPTEACIDYHYTEDLMLNIMHLNAGFNCCPGRIYASFEITADTIVITEYEKEAGCDCDCLFDVEFQVKNLAAGTYNLKIIEPYLGSENEQFNFEIVVSSGIQDRYCLTRTGYPWGEYP